MGSTMASTVGVMPSHLQCIWSPTNPSVYIHVRELLDPSSSYGCSRILLSFHELQREPILPFVWHQEILQSAAPPRTEFLSLNFTTPLLSLTHSLYGILLLGLFKRSIRHDAMDELLISY